MRVLIAMGCLAFAPCISAAAQTTCSPHALSGTAREVSSLRQQLHGEAVGEADPVIPEGIGRQLGALKGALARAAQAAFACASTADAPEQVQSRLAEALHANLPPSDSTPEGKGKTDVGTYGTDLAVQVYELFGKPRLFEVDFRYGIECGDDHLLLIFEAAQDHWREQMQWGAAQYRTVGDALGDFVLLTPLTGSYLHPTWRYVLAHGHPSCSDAPRPSTFALDLLVPRAGTETPDVAWHFEHGYVQGSAVPRLTTTEDTIDFRLRPEIAGAGSKGPDAAASPSSQQSNKGASDPSSSSEAAPDTSKADVYRFHLTPDGRITPAQQP